MKTIKQTYHIEAPPLKVWQSLVDPEMIVEWGGGPAKMSDEEGSSFSLWGGDIWGTNKEIHAPKKLVQEWHSGKAGPATMVTFTLAQDKHGTRIDLLHEDVPSEDYDSIESGWDEYYLGAIKEYLERK